MREPAVRAAAQEQAGEEMAAQATAEEEPKNEVIEHAMTSEGKETSSRGLDEEFSAGQRLGGRK